MQHADGIYNKKKKHTTAYVSTGKVKWFTVKEYILTEVYLFHRL